MRNPHENTPEAERRTLEREREELKAMWVEAFRKGPEMQALLLRAIEPDLKRVGLLRPDLDED